MRLRWMVLGFSLLACGCQTQNQGGAPAVQRAAAPPPTDGWTINRTLTPPAAKDPTLVVRLCLAKTGEAWTAAGETCDLSKSGSERLVLDYETKTITVDARAPTQAELSASGKGHHAAKGSTGNPKGTEWECFYGLFGTGGLGPNRSAGYSICTSDFASNASIAASVMGLPNLAFATARSLVGINEDKVREALRQSGGLDSGRNIVVARIVVQMRTAVDLAEYDALLARYETNLPENFRTALDPQYRREVADASPQRLKVVAERQAATEKARQELVARAQQVVEAEAAERQRRLEADRAVMAGAKRGDTVCSKKGVYRAEYVGYIEGRDGDNVQVRIAGTASGTMSEFQPQEIHWVKVSEWAPCNVSHR